MCPISVNNILITKYWGWLIVEYLLVSCININIIIIIILLLLQLTYYSLLLLFSSFNFDRHGRVPRSSPRQVDLTHNHLCIGEIVSYFVPSFSDIYFISFLFHFLIEFFASELNLFNCIHLTVLVLLFYYCISIPFRNYFWYSFLEARVHRKQPHYLHKVGTRLRTY